MSNQIIQTHHDHFVLWDEQSKYRYVCRKCGHVGRWFLDGNMADVTFDYHDEANHWMRGE